jgi:hypothetical protein
LKAPLADPTFTGNVVLPSTTSIDNVSGTEISYLNGATSNIQQQIDEKAPLAGAVFTGVISLPQTTSIGGVSDTEIQYLDGVTASIQDQLDLKSPSANPTFTGTVVLPNTTSIGDVSATEIGYVNGVTSSIQNQIDTKASNTDLTNHNNDTTGVHGIADTSELATKTYADDAVSTHNSDTTNVHGIANTESLVTLSGSQVLTGKTLSAADNTITINAADIIDVTATAAELNILDGVTATAAELNILDGVTASTTELNYVDGVTSAIQTQIDSKASLSGATFTGSVEIDQNLTVDGNLTVNGTTFSASSTSIVIEDNMVQLAHENAANTVDLGIVVAYNDGSAKHAGIVRDVSDAKWKLFKGVSTEPTTTVAFGEGSLDDLAVGAFEATSATIGNVSNTELQYLDGVTSAIQTQLNAKAPTASPTFTGTVTVAASGIAFTDGTQTKEGVPSRTTITQASAAYDLSTGGLALRDQMIEISHTGGTAVNVTVPTDATTNFPIGTSIDLLRTNTGGVQIVGASGVTVNATPGAYLRARWSSATLFKRAANTWVLMGDLASS